MNSEKLHDAMNYIDDELIEETNRRRQKKPVNKHIVLRALSYAAVACVYICVIVAVLIFINGTHRRYNAGLIGDDGISDKDILAVTDSIDEETYPSATQAPTKKPSQTSLATEVPEATSLDETAAPEASGNTDKFHSSELVQMSLNYVDEVNGKLYFSIKNLSDKTYCYGNDFSLERCENGIWKVVPFKESAIVTDEAVLLLPGEEHTWCFVSLPEYFDYLSAGSYRLRKEIYGYENISMTFYLGRDMEP